MNLKGDLGAPGTAGGEAGEDSGLKSRVKWGWIYIEGTGENSFLGVGDLESGQWMQAWSEAGVRKGGLGLCSSAEVTSGQIAWETLRELRKMVSSGAQPGPFLLSRSQH